MIELFLCRIIVVFIVCQRCTGDDNRTTWAFMSTRIDVRHFKMPHCQRLCNLVFFTKCVHYFAGQRRSYANFMDRVLGLRAAVMFQFVLSWGLNFLVSIGTIPIGTVWIKTYETQWNTLKYPLNILLGEMNIHLLFWRDRKAGFDRQDVATGGGNDGVIPGLHSDWGYGNTVKFAVDYKHGALLSPCFPLAFPLLSPCFPLAFPLLSPCFPLAFPLLSPCFPLAFPLLSPCFPLAFPLLSPCFPLAFPLLSPCFPVVSPWFLWKKALH